MTRLLPILHQIRVLVSLLALITMGNAQAQSSQFDTRGREFWLGFMQNASGTQQLSLKIASTTATSGTISIPLVGWSTTFSVAANAVATITIPSSAEHIGSESVLDRGIHVVTVDPVTVTALNYQNQTTDASQVLPVASLGTSYRVEALTGTNIAYPNGTFMFRSEFLIAATEDGTIVEITPSVTTTAGHLANIPFTVNMNAGQTYQVQALSGITDLTGTLIQGTAESGPCRPFSVFGGSMCAVVGCAACDHVNEQMVPITNWGVEFHTIPFANSSLYGYRIMAGEDNTSVMIDGAGPIILNAGQYHTVLNSNQAVCIVGDQPISVTQMMQGMTCAGSGDPSLLVLEADDRMSTSSVFTTFPSTQAVIAHFLNVLTPSGSTGQLQIDGIQVPPVLFQTYPGCVGMSYAKIPIPAGTHQVTSSAGFIAYSYGSATGESYLCSISNEMIVPVPQDTMICSSGPITLSAPISLSNAQWTMLSDPNTVLATGNSYSFTPDHNDIYQVDGDLSPSGCPQHFEFHVGLPVDPTLDLTANGVESATICPYQPVQLNVSPIPDPLSFDVHWSPSPLVNDPAVPDPTAYPDSDTWYKLSVTSNAGCGSAVDSILVTVSPGSYRSILTSTENDSICAGNTILLHAQMEDVMRTDAFEGGWAPWWELVSGGSTSDVCGSVTGTSLYFNGAGLRVAVASPMDFSDGGVVRFFLKIAGGVAPCDDAETGEGVVLEYSLDGITWVLLVSYHQSDYPDFTELSATVPPLGSGGTATRLRWRQLANSGAGQDNWGLDQLSIASYVAPSAVAWSPVASVTSPTSATTSAMPLSDTWYTATHTTPSGCSYSDSVLIHVAPAFSILPMTDTVRCGSAGIQLHAQSSADSAVVWNWSPSNGSLSSTTIASPIATPLVTTTYSVSATSPIGCTDTKQLSIAVSGLSSVSTQAVDPSLCHGEQADLSATVSSTAPYSVAWTPDATITDPQANSTTAFPDSSTSFTCTIIDSGTGCSMTSTTAVSVSPAYSATTLADTTVCSSLGMQLPLQHNVSAPFQITWSPATNLNANNIANPTILVDTTNMYTVTITDGNGCSVSDSTEITVAFDNLITPISLASCEGDSLTLNAGFPGAAYEWNTNEQSQSITITTPGTYTAEITDSNQCQAIKTFSVVFNPLPIVDLGPDTLLCGANSLILDAYAPGDAILWSTGGTGQQLEVTVSGTYSLTVTTPPGCHSDDAIQISFAPLPTDDLQDIITCIGNAPQLNAGNAGSTYLWNTAENTQSIQPDTNGTYSVLVTTAQHCSSTFHAQVDLMPLISIDLGNDSVLCEGQVLLLHPAITGADLMWNNGTTSDTLLVQSSGLYSVHATNGYCTDDDSITVLFNPLPSDELQDLTACFGETLVLDAGNPGATHVWSNSEQTASISVTVAGVYFVTLTDANGCSATYDAEVAFVAPPTVDLGPDTVLCEGDVIVLDAGGPWASYAWSNGTTASQLQVVGSGTYEVTVGNGYCTSTDGIRVIFNPSPSFMPTHQYFTCLDEEPHYTAIDAGNPGSSYVWSNGQHAQINQNDRYGWIGVIITNDFGCSLEDSALVHEFCQPTIFVPNTFTPNNDGVNDVWSPVGNNIVDYEVHVFDRWGGVIFHSTQLDQGWDGTINGEPARNDLYAWKMTYRLQERTDGAAGFRQERMGHVQVLR